MIHPLRIWRRLVERWTAPKDRTAVRTIPAVKGLELTSETFRARLCEMGDRLGVNPAWLAAVMSIETAGTFRADIRNRRSHFVGLIQFGPDAARMVGSSCDSLSRMSNVEQLKFVEAFFRPQAHRIKSVDDAYLAVFAPAYLGKAPTTPVYVSPSKAYEQNRELDRSGDGTITVAEATAPARAVLAAALNRPPLDANPLPWAGVVGFVVLLAFAGALTRIL
jgi:hypothetical protein